MEQLTIEEIRTLQLSLDNMAEDGMTGGGIAKLLALHNKLDRIANAQQGVQLTAAVVESDGENQDSGGN